MLEFENLWINAVVTFTVDLVGQARLITILTVSFSESTMHVPLAVLILISLNLSTQKTWEQKIIIIFLAPIMTEIEMISIVVERPWPTRLMVTWHSARDQSKFDFIQKPRKTKRNILLWHLMTGIKMVSIVVKRHRNSRWRDKYIYIYMMCISLVSARWFH